MDSTATPTTAKQFLAISVKGDFKQLIEGEIVVGEPLPIHGALQVKLAAALQLWTEGADARGLALLPTDVILDEYNVYGPDVLWIAERNRPADLRQRLSRLPDLCVEIRSPSTWRYDVGAKKSVYERAGLPELWLVDDVAETVLIFRRSSPRADRFDVALELGKGEVLTSPQLEGFELPLDDLFRR